MAKLNTLTAALMDDLAGLLEGLAADPALAAVVLAGAGDRAWIGGANIDEMSALTPDTARGFILRIHRVCAAIRAVPVPVIAKMRGFTLGAGLEIAAACDLRVAAEGSQFGMPEVKLGIPSVVEAALLPMLIGWGRTRELLMFGQIIPAGTAERWGLVERVVPPEALDSVVAGYVAALLEQPPRAVRQQKALMLDWERMTPDDAIAAGVEAFVEAWRTDEPRDAMQAFLARKRQT